MSAVLQSALVPPQSAVANTEAWCDCVWWQQPVQIPLGACHKASVNVCQQLLLCTVPCAALG